jgi:hypothetical protein
MCGIHLQHLDRLFSLDFLHLLLGDITPGEVQDVFFIQFTVHPRTPRSPNHQSVPRYTLVDVTQALDAAHGHNVWDDGTISPFGLAGNGECAGPAGLYVRLGVYAVESFTDPTEVIGQEACGQSFGASVRVSIDADLQAMGKDSDKSQKLTSDRFPQHSLYFAGAWVWVCLTDK